MRRIYIILIIGMLTISCDNKQNIEIDTFYSRNETSLSNEGTKSFYFLVTGYTGSNKDYDIIEKHACTIHRDSLHRIYKQFWFNYYQKSKKTNNANIKKNPKDFDYYSLYNDKIAQYSFYADSLVLRRKYFLQEYEKNTDYFKEYDLCK